MQFPRTYSNFRKRNARDYVNNLILNSGTQTIAKLLNTFHTVWKFVDHVFFRTIIYLILKTGVMITYEETPHSSTGTYYYYHLQWSYPWKYTSKYFTLHWKSKFTIEILPARLGKKKPKCIQIGVFKTRILMFKK